MKWNYKCCMDYSTRTDITHFAVPQNKVNVKFPFFTNILFVISY